MIPYKQENKQVIDILKLTLGICSISEQMHIISNHNISYEKRKRLIDFHNKERNINTGIRIPVTDVDSLMVQIIKSIFGNYYDGIISPTARGTDKWNIKLFPARTKSFESYCSIHRSTDMSRNISMCFRKG
jgi:hypothetical protein